MVYNTVTMFKSTILNTQPQEEIVRKLLLVTLALLVLAGAGMAREIEVGPYLIEDVGGGSWIYAPYNGAEPPSESDLINDNGSPGSNWSGPSGYATTFDITFDCWLVEMSAYAYTYGQTHNVLLNCFGWTGSKPDETDSYFGGEVSFPGSGPYNNEWAIFDVSDEGAFFENGDRITLFFKGGSYPWYCRMDTSGGGAPARSGWFWFGGSSWTDYSQYGFGACMIRGVIDDDMDGPYVDGQDPADGDWTADDSQFVFHAKDDDKGVDDTTIDVSVDDDTKADVPGDLDISGTPADYTCTFTPDDPFDDGTYDATVPASLADLLGNEMGSDETWSFGVDTTAPTVGGQDPADGAEDVDPNSNIIFHVYDPGIGVDTSSIDFTVTDSSLGSFSVGNLALSAGSGALSPDFKAAGDISGDLDIDDGDPNDVICTFDPDDPLPPDTITCTVAAGLADELDNDTDSDIVWSFDIIGSGVDDNATWGQIKAEF